MCQWYYAGWFDLNLRAADIFFGAGCIYSLYYDKLMGLKYIIINIYNTNTHCIVGSTNNK